MNMPEIINKVVGLKVLNKTIIVIFVSVVLFCCPCDKTSAKDTTKPVSYILKLKPEISVSGLTAFGKIQPVFADMFSDFGNSLFKINNLRTSLERYYIVENAESLSFNELSELRRSAEIFEPDYVYTVDKSEVIVNDPIYPEQWGLSAIEADKAWNIATGKGIVVGIVDTGIDFDHEDLRSALMINVAEDINGNGKFDAWSVTDTLNGVSGDIDGIDNDGNGLIDDIVGYDFVDEKVQNFGDYSLHDGIPYDENGHGTQVAGVIAATANNGKGIAGIARDSKIIMARAFDITGQGESDDIAKAIIYLVGRGVKVINLSFGEAYYSHLVAEAIDYAVSCGITVVASSGNNGWAYFHYPSDLQNVISVGNANFYNNKYSRYYSSSYGSNLSLLAPGTKIHTTSVGNGYKTATGTSLSAPAVSACVALLLEKNNGLTPTQIRSIIETNATPISTIERNEQEGAGLLNINKSLLYAEPAEIAIKTPEEFEVFHSGKDSVITIIGTAIAPLFDSLTVTLQDAAAKSDTLYTPVVLHNQVKNDTIAVFENIGRSTLYNSDGSEYEPENGQMIIKFDMALKNGKSVGKALMIEVMNDDEQLLIDSSSVSRIVNGVETSAIVGVKTNLYSFASTKVFLNGELVAVQSDNDLYSRYHSILLENLISGTEYKIVLDVSRRDGEKISEEMSFSTDTLCNAAFFKDLNYAGLGFGGNMISTKGLLGNDNYGILICSFDSEGIYDSTKLLTFADGKFISSDCSGYPYLPLAVGNVRGEGVRDVLMSESHSFYLFNYSPDDKRLFDHKFYTDSEKYRTGLAIYDFDGDGRDEILSFSDSCFYIDKYVGNSLQTIAQSNYNIYAGAMPGVAIGDFDSDGNPEFAHSDRYGNLYIEEFNAGEKSIIQEAYIKINNYNDYDYHYFASGDFDGDGKREIAFMYPEKFYTDGNYTYGADAEPKELIWKLRIYKASAKNEYSELENLRCEFANAKIGVGGYFLRHGLSAGNVDNEAGDELIVSTYPELYVMKNVNDQLTPICNRSNVFSPNPMIFDFDSDGINEILYSQVDSVCSIEYVKDSEKFFPPTDIRGWAVDKDEYYIEWKNPANSVATQIWEHSVYGNFADVMLAETSDSIYYLRSWRENPGVIYFKSVYADSILSYSSRQFLFVVKEASAPVKAVYADEVLKISFSGKIAYSVEPEIFKIISGVDTLIPSSSQFAGDYTYVLTFDRRLEAGKYTVDIGSFFDKYSNPTKPINLQFTVPGKEVIPDSVYLLRLLSREDDYPSIELFFSESVGESALNADNYELRPTGYIDRIERNSDNSVIIRFEACKGIGAMGKEYLITAKNIFSADSAMVITQGEGNTLAFVFTTDNYNSAYIYPQPVKLAQETHAWFANIPRFASVEIYTLEGKQLNTLTENNGTGGIEWDLRDSAGDFLNSGVYLFKVKDASGNTSKLKKLVIVR